MRRLTPEEEALLEQVFRAAEDAMVEAYRLRVRAALSKPDAADATRSAAADLLRDVGAHARVRPSLTGLLDAADAIDAIDVLGWYRPDFLQEGSRR